MYALVEDNEIKKIITNPKPMIINDVQYPAKIFQLWSIAELNAIGIYEVITDSTNKKDEFYYTNTNEQYNYANDKVTRSWGIATPKRLEDENAVDEDGKNILDDDGNQVINYGLKTEKKRIVKQQASSLLEKTDWHNHKAFDDETYTIPDNIKTYRANVRAKSNEMESQIDACNNVDELEALYEYTEQEDGTTTRPLAEFPKEVV
tara:strand:- start:2863 stop:3477 length:615 start_codon:yes stop_codon:yes gene_type:complete